MKAVERFDRSYYERFYQNARTRVADPIYFDRLGDFIGAYVTFLDHTVATILDLGCGTGLLRDPLMKRFPNASYTGLDVSEYACERFGWVHESILEFDCDDPFDLVICHDVLQYLNATDATRAIEKLDELCDGVLFFGVLTQQDWDEHCDQDRTDADVYRRPSRWYEKRLRQFFRNAGGGLYVSRESDIVLFALEHLGG